MRLLLRRWRAADLEPLAAMHADAEVMATLGPPLTRARSDDFAARSEAGFDERGLDVWAVERADDAAFVGAVGIRPAHADLPFAPALEVGWRLARAHWGRGYATEAAAATLLYAFDELAIDEIVSYTSLVNARSQRVMQRLGMTRDPAADFDHPRVPASDPLRRHVLYRCRRDTWRRAG